MNKKYVLYLLPWFVVLIFPFYLKQLHSNFSWVDSENSKVGLIILTLLIIGLIGTRLIQDIIRMLK